MKTQISSCGMSVMNTESVEFGKIGQDLSSCIFALDCGWDTTVTV